jgi:cysteine desulfurase
MTPDRVIYMDHSATTPVHPAVREAMAPFFAEAYGNPSSLHRLGQEAHHAVEEARRQVAEILGCHPSEVVFTSGGSESDNLALRGVAFADRERGRHLIISAVEHHAVLHTAEQLAQHFGFEVTYVPVDGAGRVDPAEVQAAIRDDTVLISVMYANNEVGTIQPVAEIGAIARERDIPFHTDAVQAAAYLNLRVDELNVDLLALSGHKHYAPKGVGVLYVRRGTRLLPMLTGGGQEQNRRAGTHNVPYIVGMATALRIVHENRETENRRLAALRDRLAEGLFAAIPEAQMTGSSTDRLPGHLSLTLEDLEAEGILMGLDLEGICASSGSACTSGATEPSHVLRAMGVPLSRCYGALRFSLGYQNTGEDVEQVISVLPTLIRRLKKAMANGY